MPNATKLGILSGWSRGIDTGRFNFSNPSDLGFAFARRNHDEEAQRLVERDRREIESDWRRWVPALFRPYVSGDDGELVPFAEHHEKYWDHVWSIKSGERPNPWVSIWGRGHAKSTNAEMSAVALGARRIVRYVLYVCGTQDQADDHVANIGDMLESEPVGTYYPELGRPLVNKFGHSRGWRRNRLRTSSGFTVDAIGLDTARTRGAKLEDARPDLIIFDDLDDEADSLATVEKKIRAITRKILPAGADDMAVIAVQNRVHSDSIFARLADGRAKWLADRIVSGPIPVVEDLEWDETSEGKIRITNGTATWVGMSLARCERIINDEGLEAFLVERQHEDATLEGLVYRRSRVNAAITRGEKVEANTNARQILALDPGFSKRAALLAIQETGSEKAEMWKEYSFTRCDDEHIAETAAKHILDWDVEHLYYDAEAPELAAAIRKNVRRLARARGVKSRCRYQKVPFNRYKRYAIKTTRWLLQSDRIAWGAKTTEVHVPAGADDYKVTEEPSIFCKEIREYKLKEGTDDEAVKEKDHGPDAWAAYAVRWIRVWLKNRREDDDEAGEIGDKDWIPESL